MRTLQSVLQVISWLNPSTAALNHEVLQAQKNRRLVLELFPHHPSQGQPQSVAVALPSGSVPVWQLDHAEIDRKLGYFGHARFVGIYYERRGEEVMWGDGWSTGFGTGAWMYFLDEIAPLVASYEVNVGDNNVQGLEVLVLDRLERLAYFVNREQAERLLVEQYERPQEP